MSIQTIGGPTSRAHGGRPGQSMGAPEAADTPTADCLEFVRFCYRRRRVSWPALYDEMCAVAARGAFRGLGYVELAERGINFCLSDLPQLAALTEIVMGEERGAREARSQADPPPVAPLAIAPAAT